MLTKNWIELVDLPELEEKLTSVLDEISMESKGDELQKIHALLNIRKMLQNAYTRLQHSNEKIETVYLDISHQQVIFGLFAEAMQKIETNTDTDINTILELGQMGIAVSKVDGFWTPENNALLGRMEELERAHASGKLSKDAYLNGLRTVFSNFGDNSSILVEKIEERVKHFVELQLQELGVTENRMKIETEQAVSGYYRGSVFNLTNNLLSIIFARFPKTAPSRMSVGEMKKMLG